MWIITLATCCFFATRSHAGIIAGYDNLASNSQDIVKKLLVEISSSCLNSTDYEELAGNIVKHGVARAFSANLIIKYLTIIAMSESRTALNFAPLQPPWIYPSKIVTEEKLAFAPTIEEYYDLRETFLDIDYIERNMLMEKNIPPAMTFMDKRFPSIRTVFRHLTQEMVQLKNGGAMNREDIDRWVDKLHKTRYEITDAFLECAKNDTRFLKLVSC